MKRKCLLENLKCELCELYHLFPTAPISKHEVSTCSWDSTLATPTFSMKPGTKSGRLKLRLPLRPEMNSHHLIQCKISLEAAVH